MREILFRGKRVDNGEWVYGYPMIDNALCSLKAEGKCACSHDGSTAYMLYWNDDFHEYDSVRVAANTIGQYTGLTDTNGVKIFEGDICRDESSIYLIVWGKYQWECKVIHSDCVLVLDCAFPLWQWDNCKENGYRSLEVIGNIHDNPELLEESPQ